MKGVKLRFAEESRSTFFHCYQSDCAGYLLCVKLHNFYLSVSLIWLKANHYRTSNKIMHQTEYFWRYVQLNQASEVHKWFDILLRLKNPFVCGGLFFWFFGSLNPCAATHFLSNKLLTCGTARAKVSASISRLESGSYIPLIEPGKRKRGNCTCFRCKSYVVPSIQT